MIQFIAHLKLGVCLLYVRHLLLEGDKEHKTNTKKSYFTQIFFWVNILIMFRDETDEVTGSLAFLPC